MNTNSPPYTASLRQRALGQVRYTADLVPRDAIFAEMVRCPHAHARVTRLDSRAALKIPGVLAVLTPEDFQGVALGHIVADEPVLSTVARYVGDNVAAVAANDPQSLMRGIEALEIEYEVLPHVLSIDESLRLQTAIHPHCADNVADTFKADRGDWDATISRVALWVEDTFETAAVAHAYLEPRACLVRFDGDRLELVSGSHAPSKMLDCYRPIVEGWGAKLEVVTPAIGGSFGGKWEHPTHLVCLAFAHRTRRNVSMVLSRRDDMIAGRTRLPIRFQMRIGATAEGELIAKETTVWADNGAYSLHGPSVMRAATFRGDNIYRFQATKARAQLLYTNNMPTECFRGFGTPQSSFAQEQLVDEIAQRLDLDPAQLRRTNTVNEGETTLHGWQIKSCGISDCLDAVSQRIDSHRERTPLPTDERYRIGYGLAAFTHLIGNRGTNPAYDGASVKLTVMPDGRIRISSGEVELGCGSVEVLLTTVARELGIDPERLDVLLGDTAIGPHGQGSFASRTAFFAGSAAIDACRQFIVETRRLAAEFGMSSADDLLEVIARACLQDRIAELEVTGEYQPSGVVVPDENGYGNISAAYPFGVHGCAVRIDTRTGRLAVMQYWAAHDAGKIINHSGAEGQVLGGVVQGLGMALTEAVSVAPDGRVLNPGYLDDRVATFPDAVPVEVIFTSTFENSGPDGAKSIAEPPIIPVAACVANAINNAIGVRLCELPMTSERIWRALQSKSAERSKASLLAG